MRMFPGLRSLWTMFCSLRAFMPWAAGEERGRRGGGRRGETGEEAGEGRGETGEEAGEGRGDGGGGRRGERGEGSSHYTYY